MISDVEESLDVALKHASGNADKVSLIDGLETYLDGYDRVDGEIVDYGFVVLREEGVWS